MTTQNRNLPNVTRLVENMQLIMGANGRKFLLNSISGTTSSAATVIMQTDALGPIAAGTLVVIQFAVGTGGGWYALGASPTADATCVFLPEGYQEFVYLMPQDTSIAVMCATANGIVNLFNVR